MLTFFKSIPKPILIIGGTIIILALIATYQWGVINGKKS